MDARYLPRLYGTTEPSLQVFPALMGAVFFFLGITLNRTLRHEVQETKLAAPETDSSQN